MTSIKRRRLAIFYVYCLEVGFMGGCFAVYHWWALLIFVALIAIHEAAFEGF